MNENFKEWIRKCRIDSKATIREVAAKVDRTPSFIAEMESGVRMPPKEPALVKRLARALGIDADHLVKLAIEGRKKPQDDSKVMDFFRSKGDLAFTLCREADDADEASLERIIKELQREKSEND